MSSNPVPQAQPLPSADDARWRLFPDGHRAYREPTADELAAVRGAQRSATWRGLGIVVSGVAAGVVAWRFAPALFVVVFLALAVGVVVGHRRNARRVQRGFERWCAERGLAHVAGRVSALHPKAVIDRADSVAQQALHSVFDRGAKLDCQVAGRLWDASPSGHVSVVRMSNRGNQDGQRYLVVDVPLDASLVARYTAGEHLRIGAPSIDTGHRIATAIVEEVARMSFANDVGATICEGRYVAWFPTTAGFFWAARATAVAAREIRPAPAGIGAVLVLDHQLACVRDHYRALTTSRV